MSIEFVKKAVETGLKDYVTIFKDNNVMVAGGLFTSLFTRTDVNDIDCYFRSKKDLVNFIYDMSENSSYPYFTNVTDKSLTLTANGYPTIQLIYFSYFENLTEVFKSFDFTISMCGYDFKTGHIEHHEDFLADIALRQLSFNKETDFPLISGLRVNKFRDRGYSISRSQMLKIMLAVSQVKIDSLEDFVKQVGGAYGNAALSLLNEEEGPFDIDKALEKFAELEGEDKRNLLIKDSVVNFKCDTVDLNTMASIILTDEPFSGGWFRKDLNEFNNYIDKKDFIAVYRDENDHQREIPLNIALLFAKDKEVKNIKLTEGKGIFYKYVSKTDEPFVYKSIYNPSFKYELGKEIYSGSPGIFMHHKSDIGPMSYGYSQENAILLACVVEYKDLIKNSTSSNKSFTASKVLPVAEFNKHMTEETLGSYPNSPDISPIGEIRLEKSKDISHRVKGEEEILKILGNLKVTASNKNVTILSLEDAEFDPEDIDDC